MTKYKIDNGDRLVRIDGNVWPIAQDLTAETTEPDTFAVTYFRGSAPTLMDDWAAGLLAYEFARACAGESR